MTTVDADTQLMLAFCSGDLDAFRRLVERNSSVVFKLAARYLDDESEAEDIVQEVFLRVHGSAGDYKPSAKFTTWVYRITVNVCLNRLRAAKSRPLVSLEGLGEDPEEVSFDAAAEDTEAPSARIEQRELEDRIRAAVASLPEAQRTAILLRRFEELSYEDIAETMETTVPAVKSLLSRARQTLKACLVKYL
jgi:RNA polymerase sigma-70 factor, ECF subfamily